MSPFYRCSCHPFNSVLAKHWADSGDRKITVCLGEERNSSPVYWGRKTCKQICIWATWSGQGKNLLHKELSEAGSGGKKNQRATKIRTVKCRLWTWGHHFYLCLIYSISLSICKNCMFVSLLSHWQQLSTFFAILFLSFPVYLPFYVVL